MSSKPARQSRGKGVAYTHPRSPKELVKLAALMVPLFSQSYDPMAFKTDTGLADCSI